VFTLVARNQEVTPAQPVSCFCSPPRRRAPVTVLTNMPCGQREGDMVVCTSPFPVLPLAVAGDTLTPLQRAGGGGGALAAGEGPT